MISLNARGHSPSTDIDAATASFEVFADDVIALADHLRLARFIVGGISLGAGTALNVAVRYPDRVTALVLCRPAWLDRPQAEFNRNAYTEIADSSTVIPPRAPQSATRKHAHIRPSATVRPQPRHPFSASSPAHVQPRTRSSCAPSQVPARRTRPTPGGPSTCPRLSSGTTTTPSTRTRSPKPTPTRSPAPPAHRPQQRRRRCTLRRRHPNRTPQLPPPTVSTM